MVDFDDIVLFKVGSSVPIWKTIWSGLSLKRGFTWSAIHLTVAPWEGRANTSELSVLPEMSYTLTCLTILSINSYIYPFCTWWFLHIFIIYTISANIILDCSWVVKVISVGSWVVIFINPAIVFAIIICNFIR